MKTDEKILQKCITCHIDKPLDRFYRNVKLKYGRGYECKNCINVKAKARDKRNAESPEFREKERRRARERYYRLGKKKPTTEQRRIYDQNTKNRYPEKSLANDLARRDVPCDKGFMRHHWSYLLEHASDVIILKNKDHFYIHRYITYDKESMMYRIKSTGDLLNTRISHENYIKSLLSPSNQV